MPDWVPNWSDVPFDHAAAAAAADACEGAARTVSEAAATDEREVRLATGDAEGARVDRLVRRYARVRGEARAVAARLRATAAAIREAAIRARAEQDDREAARERWQAEADLERLLAGASAP